MQAFRLNNQTDLRFGPLKEADLKAAVSQFGDRVLFVYGGHSIKASGLYDRVIKALSGLHVTELPGIAPNPKIASVRRQEAGKGQQHSGDPGRRRRLGH